VPKLQAFQRSTLKNLDRISSISLDLLNLPRGESLVSHAEHVQLRGRANNSPDNRTEIQARLLARLVTGELMRHPGFETR
jgi:hypothetical protein